MPRLTRVLFIGVDAGDKDLILAWAEAGVLPTFRSLLARGAWALTDNPVGLYEGAVWPSFWTGLSPSRHGRYCHTQVRAGTYEYHRVTPHDTRGEPFWDHLSRHGDRVAIVDVPKTLPSPRVNGIQIVDWGTHDPELSARTWPESLAREIASRFGPHPVDQCDEYMARGPDAYSRLRHDLVRGVQKKTELARFFLEQGGWDLFLTVFAESHCVGHQCWHLHDPRHPAHNPELARAIGDPIKDVYVAIDAAMAGLLEQVGEETTVIVLASHGMGPHCDANLLLDTMLRRLEHPRPPAARRGLARAAEWGWAHLPEAVRRMARPARTAIKQSLSDAVTTSDHAHRKCFQVPNNDAWGGIRVNLVGREPQGRVEPGAEYQTFCDQLTRDLLAFINVDTGQPLVQRVLRTADLYRGERVADLPDLLVEWDRASPVSTVHSPRAGTIHKTARRRRTGDHKPHGLLIVTGPSITARRCLPPVSIMQVGPTIAALLGTPLPNGDGQAIPELAFASAARGDRGG